MKSSSKKNLSEAYINQINVLKTFTPDQRSQGQLEIDEIAERSGLEDEKEVLRYLYILEGQKLVTPQPVGDFTSKTWTITIDGIKVLKTISSAVAA